MAKLLRVLLTDVMHKELKLRAVAEEITMRELVEQAINLRLDNLVVSVAPKKEKKPKVRIVTQKEIKQNSVTITDNHDYTFIVPEKQKSMDVLICDECKRPNLPGKHSGACGYAQRMGK